METLSEVATLLQALVSSMVSRPELVWVEEVVGHQALIIEVHVAPTDLVEVMGRHGKTLDAIRDALLRLARAERPRYILNIIGDRFTWEPDSPPEFDELSAPVPMLEADEETLRKAARYNSF